MIVRPAELQLRRAATTVYGAMVPDITVHQVLTTRLKIPYPPHHFRRSDEPPGEVRSPDRLQSRHSDTALRPLQPVRG